jgi:protein-disulfide isomerase
LIDDPPTIEKQNAEKTALTIHIHTWATPIVGLVMLVFGLLAGYAARPLVSPLLSRATPTPTVIAEVDASETTAAQQGLKDIVVAQTKHFLGEPDAPVTLIEFSDYQ